MEQFKNPIIKVAFYNDKLDGILKGMDINNIDNIKMKYELRLLRDACKRFTNHSSKVLGKSAYVFGDAYDHIDEIIEREIGQIIQ